jgi:hypothetical protein
MDVAPCLRLRFADQRRQPPTAPKRLTPQAIEELREHVRKADEEIHSKLAARDMCCLHTGAIILVPLHPQNPSQAR